MSPLKIFCLVVLIPFTVLTVYAVSQVGYFGIFDYHRHSPAGWQVITDLVLSLSLVLIWMVADARKKARTVWPYVLLTLAAGCFGPLFYLLFAPSSAEA